MEIALTKEKVNAKAVARQGAIGITVGAVYFGLLVANPLSALTGVASLAMYAKLRFANLLAPLALSNPGAILGMAMASWYFNIYSGRATLFTYPAMTIAFMGVLLGMHTVSKKIGRSTKKDLAVLAIFGALLGAIASLNLMVIASWTQSATWSQLLQVGVLWKIVNHSIIFMAGYPITKFIEGKLNK
jgi:hypothetical protein